MDRRLLSQAVVVARSSRDHGNHPFGALLADPTGRVVKSAENTVVTEADATGHAETNLVRLASAAYRVDELAGMTLYTSTEPCAMCSGAIYWSGIGTVVYARGEDELYEMTGADANQPHPGAALPDRFCCRAAADHRRGTVRPAGGHRGARRVLAALTPDVM